VTFVGIKKLKKLIHFGQHFKRVFFLFYSSTLKSVLRKSATRSMASTAGSSAASSSKSDGSKVAKSMLASEAAGFDFIEGSDFVIEGLEDKGLDAKTYIQQMLRRTEGSSREEQIIQKEQILAELQRVEKELQEKAHAQMMLTTTTSGSGAAPDCNDQVPATEILENMAHLSLDSSGSGLPAAAATIATTPVAAVPTSTSSSLAARNVTNLANLPPSERPKAKPSRKIGNNNNQQNNSLNNAAANSNAAVIAANDKGKKCQLQVH
jgi:hypothetical protein